jgi:hypothetical protein
VQEALVSVANQQICSMSNNETIATVELLAQQLRGTDPFVAKAVYTPNDGFVFVIWQWMQIGTRHAMS